VTGTHWQNVCDPAPGVQFESLKSLTVVRGSIFAAVRCMDIRLPTYSAPSSDSQQSESGSRLVALNNMDLSNPYSSLHFHPSRSWRLSSSRECAWIPTTSRSEGETSPRHPLPSPYGSMSSIIYGPVQLSKRSTSVLRLRNTSGVKRIDLLVSSLAHTAMAMKSSCTVEHSLARRFRAISTTPYHSRSRPGSSSGTTDYNKDWVTRTGEEWIELYVVAQEPS